MCIRRSFRGTVWSYLQILYREKLSVELRIKRIEVFAVEFFLDDPETFTETGRLK